MNWFKLSLFAFILMGFGLAFTSCDEETTAVGDGPEILSLSHYVAPEGAVVTITGSGFGDEDEGDLKGVKVNADWIPGGDAAFVTWTDTKIEFKVMTGFTSGELYVDIDGEMSNKVNFYVGAINPETPANIAATSANETTVKVKWDKVEADENDWAVFNANKYTVTVMDGDTEVETIGTNDPMVTVDGLTTGTVYTFKVVATYKGDFVTETPAMIEWSPANYFQNDLDEPFEVWETASSNGSGVDLYDGDMSTPAVYSVANSNKWNLGLDTRTSVEFGSAAAIGYNWTGGEPQATEIAGPFFAPTMDAQFDSQAMDEQMYSSKVVDLTTLTPGEGNNVIFYVRTMEAGQTEYNYAKIMIHANGGAYLFDDADDKYIKCEISYQMTAGVPFAKTAAK